MVAEHVLTDKEKIYLSAVINPFKSKVEFLKKVSGRTFEYEYIYGRVNANGFSLPMFEKGAMYKEMRANKEYTLEELGLEQ